LSRLVTLGPLLLALLLLALLPLAAAEKEPEWETSTAGTVTGVAATADGELLAAGYGTRVGLWNTSGPTPMEMWIRGPGVTSVAMSADGRQLVAAEESNHRLTLWEDRVETWTYSGVLSFNSVGISADGAYLVAGDENYAYLFNLSRANNNMLWSYNPGSAVNLVAISPDGERIAAATRNGNLLLWERSVSDPLWSYTDAAAINGLAFSLDGGWLAVATPGGALVFNSNSNDPALEFPVGTAFSAVAAHPGGELFAAGTEAGDLYLLDRTNGSAAWSRSLEGEVASLTFNGPGSHLLVGTAGKQLALLATGNGDPLWTASTTAAVTRVATSWRGHWLLAGMENRLALYYEPALDNQPPNATIVSIAPATAMPGWNVTFNGSGSDGDGEIVEYRWFSSRDGLLSNQSAFNSSTLTTGYHTVSFKVRDNDGVWSEPVTREIAIGDYPSAEVLAVEPCSLQGECVLLHGTEVIFRGTGLKLTAGSANLTNFSWESDLDGVLSTVAEFSTTALSNGSHTITFRVGNEAGLWSSNTTFFLRLNGQPICLITEAPPQAEFGALVVLSGAGYDAEGEVVAYFWNSSLDGKLSERDSFSSSELSPGTHNVTLQVQDSDGAWSVPARRTLRILSLPTVTADCPAEGEVDELLQFSANASDADGNIVIYEWDFNSPSGKLIGMPDFFDSAPEALKKYDLLPPNDAFYTVVVQVTDNDELQASDTCTVFISEPPPAVSTGNDDGFALDLGEVAGISVTWLLGGTLLLVVLMVGGTWAFLQMRPLQLRPPQVRPPQTVTPWEVTQAAATSRAQDKEKHMDYDGAIAIYEGIGDKKSANRVRKLKAEESAVKVDQTPPPQRSKRRRKRVRRKPAAELVTIECPGCSARMQVPRRDGPQVVECDACGLTGELEL